MKIMDVMTSKAFDNFPEISENIKFPESLQPFLSQTFCRKSFTTRRHKEMPSNGCQQQ